MTQKSELQITEAEWEVMDRVWEAGEQTPAEIIQRVQPLRDRSHRTIRTLLNRLVEKGAVRVRTDGRQRLYSAAVSRKDCLMEAAKSFGERFFAGNIATLLMHFVDAEDISPSEAAELREKLDEITAQSKSRSKTPKAPGNKTSKAKRGQ